MWAQHARIDSESVLWIEDTEKLLAQFKSRGIEVPMAERLRALRKPAWLKIHAVEQDIEAGLQIIEIRTGCFKTTQTLTFVCANPTEYQIKLWDDMSRMFGREIKVLQMYDRNQLQGLADRGVITQQDVIDRSYLGSMRARLSGERSRGGAVP